MSQILDDDRFWELVDMYENGQLSKKDLMEDICRSTKDFNVALNDFEMATGDVATYEEKTKIRELLNAKNSKKSIKH